MTVINKIISTLLVPIYFCPFLPFIHIVKLFNQPKELISLSANGIGSDADPVFLTAHRGVTAVALENTIPAFNAAVENNYYTAECDIRLTKDNKWVLAHNDTADSYFCQIGNISELTFDEVRSFTYKRGANFWKNKDLKIATLDEYLDVFVGTSTRPQIEIKSETFEHLDTVINSVVEKGLEDSAIVISFDLEQLKAINKINDKIELWYLIDEITTDNIAEAKAIGDNVWLSPNFAANDKASIQLAIDAGINMSFWTVNTVEDAKMLYDMGIRYIETDILCK